MTEDERTEVYNLGFESGKKAFAQQVEGIIDEYDWSNSYAIEKLQEMLKEFWGDE